jgi:hypothetical protein
VSFLQPLKGQQILTPVNRSIMLRSDVLFLQTHLLMQPKIPSFWTHRTRP